MIFRSKPSFLEKKLSGWTYTNIDAPIISADFLFKFESAIKLPRVNSEFIHKSEKYVRETERRGEVGNVLTSRLWRTYMCVCIHT